MSTKIVKADESVIIRPNTCYLFTPEFSISPMHALALSNIFSPIIQDLFVPREPKWRTSPLPPSICTQRGKRHYRSTHIPRYQGSKEVNMGAYYTTDPRGLLPGKSLETNRLEELYIKQNPSLYPQSGDLVLGRKAKCAKAASSSFSSPPVQRKPILGGGIVQEIGRILYDGRVMKDDFPAPFCDLPDHTFVQWVVRNMGLLAVGAWEAECEAMDVLWRTKEKKREETLQEEMAKERAVEDEIMKEDKKKVSAMDNVIVEMMMRLDAIQKRRIEKRKKKTNVVWMWRGMKKYLEEVTAVEEFDLQTTKYRLKRSHMAQFKRCFLRK
ncbi:hypothetical protein ACET3X_001971 [Alternaria dauci]|uniref:Uncharacterized protein n=1 Tax=Alternaria dauci TaxID=48095 RepID=A0ABR3V092_9PLEO